MRLPQIATGIFLSFLLTACENEELNELTALPDFNVTVIGDIFGILPDGREVTRYTLRNKNNISISILDYGGIIQALEIPDALGQRKDIVLGFDSLDKYIDDQRYFGPIIGRYANRIEHGRYDYNGETIQLEANRKGHHLHGGSSGLHKVLWQSEIFHKDNSAGVKLIYVSPDGENGYPGTLPITAVYELNNDNELSLTFTATSDEATPVSLTNHTYFNLAGGGSILPHTLQIHAQSYTPTNQFAIPTGDITELNESPFDFRKPKAIGQDIDADNDQLHFGRGYDHNFVIKHNNNTEVLPMATLSDPNSGRQMEILSNAPGLQFYSGNFLNPNIIGKSKTPYDFRTAVVLEPQQFPNAPNVDNFPSPILMPGEIYQHTIIYRFSIIQPEN